MGKHRTRRKGRRQPSFDYEGIVRDVAQMQMATQHIPAVVAENIRKGWKQLPNTDAKRSPKTWFVDPLALQYSLGYKDRRFSLTYDTLKRVAGTLSLVSGIIQTRSAQVAAFCEPYRKTRSLGFVIKHKDADHPTTPAEIEFMKEIEAFVLNCGRAEPNPYSRVPRDDFETFLRKSVRDTLTFDQVCLVAGTVIELAGGQVVPIEDLELGMVVRTHTGRARAVTDISERLYTGKMVSINVRGQSIDATEGHPFFVSTRTSHKGNRVELSDPVWMPASEVTSGMYMTYPIPTLGDTFVKVPVFYKTPRKYPTGDLSKVAEEAGVHRQTAYHILAGSYTKNGPAVSRVIETARKHKISLVAKQLCEPETEIDELFGKVIGLYLAEGHVNGNSVIFTFNGAALDLVDTVVSFADRYGITPTVWDYEDKNAIGVRIHNTALVEFFSTYCGSGSSNKRIPEFVFKSCEKVRDAVVAGYLSGDGCVVNNGSSNTFYTTSRELFTGLRILLAAIKIYAHERKRTFTDYGWSDQYGAQISGEAYWAFAERTGISFQRPEKTSRRVVIHKNYLCVRVSKVSTYDAIDLPVYNCEIEEDHSYIANGYLSHNCWEIVPDNIGYPYEFMAVDASTIRIASDDRFIGVNSSYHSREGFVPGMPSRFAGLYEGSDYSGPTTADGERVDFVQVINGQIENIYNSKDLAFGVRNPRTDIYCFPDNTQVLTGEFVEKPISHFNVGDEVVTHDGSIGRVSKIHQRTYKGALTKIRTRSKKEYVRCTPEHPFLVIRNKNLRHLKERESLLEWIPASELETGHYLTIPKLRSRNEKWIIDTSVFLGSEFVWDSHSVWTKKASYRKNELASRAEAMELVTDEVDISIKQLKRFLYAPHEYKKETKNAIQEVCDKHGIDFDDFKAHTPRYIEVTRDVAIVFGLWIAEGSVSSDRFVNFSFHANEEYLVEFVRVFAQDVGVNYTENFHPDYQGRSITLASRALAEVFLALFGANSHEKRIPTEMFQCIEEVRCAFLEGYFLGDGSYGIRKGIPTIQVGCVAQSLVKQLELLLNTLGIFVHGTLLKYQQDMVIYGRNTTVSDVYGFTLSGHPAFQFDSVLNVFDTIKKQYTEKRRGLHYLESENYFYLRISEVTSDDYSGEVFNLAVDGNHSYVVRYAVHNCQSYGFGEIEQLITIISAHLNAESYNKNFFTQGSMPFGMLNLKGDNWSPEELEMFKRQWAAQAAGVENAWKVPVLQSEGIDWIDFKKTNQEMEFGKWLEYCIKIICGVFLIDPAELNFDLHGGVQQTPLFESSQEWKLKASRDRGLKPLLRFLAKMINKHIIDRIDDHFALEFVGLDEMSEQEKHEMLVEQISSYLTLNEARRQLDLPELPGGDIPMNPVYMQAMQLQQQQEQMEEGGGEEAPPEEPAMLPGADEEVEDAGPQYTQTFGADQPSEMN